ncbi:MAG TPA: SufD family Fe-S cluster assembly protein [Candidatus Alistipes stercoravium]|nr:SufD family Fe-S cluster assembly protein [Candidatus Alistipes stercoravium]
MDALKNLLRTFRAVEGDTLRITASETGPRGVIDPGTLHVEVAAGASAHLVVLHAAAATATLTVDLAEGAQFDLTELFLSEAFAEVSVSQAARSRCRMTAVELTSANASYRIDLRGADAESAFGGAFLAADREHCVLKLHTAHLVPDCRSDSSVRGVAGGEAVGEFYGMVYVAPDAQRTDARQQSRNVLLSERARITTQPQLEIYADDVKCSHGATVGQMDAEAILYMRQRGLSEADARRLQIEGFVGDIVRRCEIESLSETVMELVSAKMGEM